MEQAKASETLFLFICHEVTRSCSPLHNTSSFFSLSAAGHQQILSLLLLSVIRSLGLEQASI